MPLPVWGGNSLFFVHKYDKQKLPSEQKIGLRLFNTVLKKPN